MKKFTVAYDPKKDAKDVDFSTETLANEIVGQLFSDAKTFVSQAIGWDKFKEQSRVFHQKVDADIGRLNKVKCNATPTDKSAGYVQDLIKTKAKDAREYISISSVRVTCSGGHMAVELEYDPVKPKAAATFPPK